MNPLKLEKMTFKSNFLLLIIFCLNLTQQAYSMNKNEKHLSLEIYSENINYYVKFNNTMIINTTGHTPNKESAPINQWVLNGKNEILISANLKDEDKDIKLESSKSSQLIVKLVLTEIINNTKNSYILTTFNLSPSEDSPKVIASSSTSKLKLDSNNNYIISETGDVIIGELISKERKKWTRFYQDININLNMPKWAYLDADDLGDDQTLSDDDYYALQDEVYEALEHIWSLMKKKDLNAVLELTKIRSNDYDKAYYLTPGSKQKEMEQSLTSAFNHKDLYLDELVEKNFSNLKIEANGKIARLQVKKVGGPMMYYSHKDEAFTRYYEFYFMKKNGKLIVVR